MAKTSWSDSDTHADSEPNANWNRKPNSDAHAYSNGNCDWNTKAEPDTQRNSHAAPAPNANAASYAAELRHNPLIEEQKTRQGQRTALSLPLSI